jgi:hypothetical protein
VADFSGIDLSGLSAAIAAMPDGMKLCSDCAEKADFANQTGFGCPIPEKVTCEGCGQDVTFVVRTPRTGMRLLLLESKLAVEEEEKCRMKK